MGSRESSLQPDALLDCLVELTRIHRRPGSRSSLVSGLPIAKSGLTPSLFARAATRAGLSSKILRRPLVAIDSALLPVVLLLKSGGACLLVSWSETGDEANLLFPDTGEGAVVLSKAELDSRYAGIAIFARPKFRFDRRTPAKPALAGHWFWGVVREQLPLYRDILAAALLVNLFALGLPLFSMNVYDRVVPNNAVETLWALAIGVVLVLAADLFMRLLRSHFVDEVSARVDVQISAALLEKVLGLRLEHRPESVGAFAADLRVFEQVRKFIALGTVTALIDLPFALFFVMAMAHLHRQRRRSYRDRNAER